MRIFLFLALIPAAFGQLFSYGIKVGAPMTDPFSSGTFPNPVAAGGSIQSFSDAKKFIIGPMVELHLPFGFSINADGLYRPLRLTMILTQPNVANGQNSANYASWEVTPSLRYRFLHTPVVKPFVGAGPSFRFIESPVDHSLSDHGFTLGGGVEVKILRLGITPELRYTRWGSDHNLIPSFPFQSDQNQAEFLVGFSF